MGSSQEMQSICTSTVLLNEATGFGLRLLRLLLLRRLASGLAGRNLCQEKKESFVALFLSWRVLCCSCCVFVCDRFHFVYTKVHNICTPIELLHEATRLLSDSAQTRGPPCVAQPS